MEITTLAVADMARTLSGRWLPLMGWVRGWLVWLEVGFGAKAVAERGDLVCLMMATTDGVGWWDVQGFGVKAEADRHWWARGGQGQSRGSQLGFQIGVGV